ncbi:MAG: hypothetical protein ABFD24_06155 [Anaerolineaceae bacterium]
MKLADATLDLARYIEEVTPSAATGGSTTTIADNTITIPNEYIGGSYWILSGTNAGKCGAIKNISGNAIVLDVTLPNAIVAGDKFAIAVKDFPLKLLRMAINTILSTYPIAKFDETLVANVLVEDYILPAGVSDVRRMEIASNDVAPYFFDVVHRWREYPGKITYFGDYCGDDADKKIRLTYIGHHGEINDADEINNAVNQSYLRAAAIVFLWRNLIQKTHRDNPVAMDLFNEAKMQEAQAVMGAFNKEASLPPRDVRYR